MTRAEFLRDQYRRLATNFERWIGICITAGEIEAAESCRADAAVYARLAEEPIENGEAA